MFLSILLLYTSVYSCNLTPISCLRYLILAPVFSEKSYVIDFILNVVWGDLCSHIFCSCYRVLYCLNGRTMKVISSSIESSCIENLQKFVFFFVIVLQ